MGIQIKNKKEGFQKKRQRDLLFYVGWMVFPLLQFIVFYLVINFNSFKLAFQGYDPLRGYFFNGFENFKTVIYDITHEYYFKQGFINSWIHYGVGLVVGLPIGLLVSFYIYKKFLYSGLYKVILFIPSVVSVVVLQIVYSNFIDGIIPEIHFASTGETMLGLLASSETRFIFIELFAVWSSFGGSMLYYVGAMSRIPDSVIEAAEIDGASLFKEFILIVLPLVWSTVKTLFVVGITGIFIVDLNLYLFYQLGAEYDTYTVGYALQRLTLSSTDSGYPYISALGMILTVITCALTFGLKWLLEKFTWEDMEF